MTIFCQLQLNYDPRKSDNDSSASSSAVHIFTAIFRATEKVKEVTRDFFQSQSSGGDLLANFNSTIPTIHLADSPSH